MLDAVVLDSSADLNLENAARIAFDGASIDISPAAQESMTAGRLRFQAYLDKVGGYVYGSTTAPGARAKMLLSAVDAARQSESMRNFCALQSGVGGVMLSRRCVRLAVFARLANALSAHGKIRPQTALAVAAMAASPPPVPLTGTACSGEVIPLTWFNAPLADLPLAVGEAMALFNGSPFASAMVADVALTLQRRLRLAELVFASSIEAAQAPAMHFDVRLGDHWPDPFYRESLRRCATLLAGSTREELKHQAPTCWRVLPNVLAGVLQALGECRAAAAISLQALKDNPTFLSGSDGAPDAVASSGGYHDHRAGKAIDQANSIMLDVGVLASKQIGRFLDGEGVALPPLLLQAGDLPGIEYVAWGLTEPLATARRAAEPTSLDIGMHDPSGNQSDVTSLAFVAYGKHLDAARAWDDCLASLAVIALFALQARSAPLPPRIRGFCAPFVAALAGQEQRMAGTGEPLRVIRETLRHLAEDASTHEFERAMEL